MPTISSGKGNRSYFESNISPRQPALRFDSMEAAAQLTPGAIQAIANGAVPAALQPVLQVLQVCRIATAKSVNASANPNPIPSERERYRLILSDGVNAHQAILATAFNPFVRDGTLRAGTIVHLNEFICDTIRDKR
jgi:replication factor A1